MKAATKEFRRCYLRTIALAAISFAVAHGSQLIATGLISQHSFSVNPTGFLVIAPYVTIEAIVFFIAGYLIAYFPSRAAYEFLRRTGRTRFAFYGLFGVAMGIAFLPLCASVPFFAFPLPDDPGYFGRCAEFGLPMTIAGALGGYVFWRCARHAAGGGELVADQFS
jgi:hypothetical protein